MKARCSVLLPERFASVSRRFHLRPPPRIRRASPECRPFTVPIPIGTPESVLLRRSLAARSPANIKQLIFDCDSIISPPRGTVNEGEVKGCDSIVNVNRERPLTLRSGWHFGRSPVVVIPGEAKDLLPDCTCKYRLTCRAFGCILDIGENTRQEDI